MTNTCPHCNKPIPRRAGECEKHYQDRKTCGHMVCITKHRRATQQQNAIARGYTATTRPDPDKEEWWQPLTPTPMFAPWDKPFQQHNIKPKRQYARLPAPALSLPHTKSGIADL